MNLQQALNVVAKAQAIQSASSGDLAIELARRLDKGTSIKLTSKGVRVTHSAYLENLTDSESINRALGSSTL